MTHRPGMRWWDRGLDRGEALFRTRGTMLAVAALGTLVLLVLLPLGEGGPEDTEVAVTIFLLELTALTALLSGGLVSSELRRGISLLWIQRGGAPQVYYLVRLAESLVLSTLLGLVLMGLQGVVLPLVGGDGVRFLASAAPAIPALVLLVGVPVFALSCSGIQGEGLGALVLLAAWLIAPTLLPSEGVTGILARGLEATSPPVEIFQGLREWGLGTGAPPGAELENFVLWVGTVALAGVLMLTVRLRDPFPSEQSR